MTNADLFNFLFADPLAEGEEVLARWILQSRRVQSFMVEYKVKVRKKLRLAQTPERLQSLLLELDIARQLVEDKRCQVEYEKHGQGRERSPDLTVTFRTRTCFNLETTRVQMGQKDAEGRAEKLIHIVCTKLGQMVPQMLNCLVIAAESGLTLEEVDSAMKSLKWRVGLGESKLRSHFSDASDFFKQFQWLNGIVLLTPSEPDESPRTVVWTNPQSRSPLPSEIRTVLQKTVTVQLAD